MPRLGSWILGRVLRRLSADWQAKYGHPIFLVETFVERERFRGTVYRAANWQHVGATQGRTRQDRNTTLRVPVKDIYVYPLARHFREVLELWPGVRGLLADGTVTGSLMALVGAEAGSGGAIRRSSGADR